ncbi:MAG TPA: DUF2628 domain-containing protein [Thermodesulfobacteriota bacterium]|nr:DUF2628 domain-containing protein [Thermodesulfobacteriota bacterium]
MAICLQCGKETGGGSLFCPYCGNKINRTSESFSDTVDEDAFKAYIGKDADFYLKKFRSFRGREDSFAVTWNWPAFWLGFIWMLYRKMYLWALIAFLLVFTPMAHLLVMIGWGVCGNYLYYRQARKKILEYKSRQALSPGSLSLKELGGVNRWVWVVGIVFFLFMMAIMVFGFLLVLYFLGYFLNDLPNFIEV